MNSIRCHKQNDSPYRNDLSSFLKVVNDVEVEQVWCCKLLRSDKQGMDTKGCTESMGLCVGEFLSLFDLQADTVYE